MVPKWGASAGFEEGDEELEELAQGSVSVICVGWAGICVDSGRQIPTLAEADDGISCSPPMIYAV